MNVTVTFVTKTQTVLTTMEAMTAIVNLALPETVLHFATVRNYQAYYINIQGDKYYSLLENKFNPKRAGLFGPISQPGGGRIPPPPQDLGNRLTKYQVCGTSG